MFFNIENRFIRLPRWVWMVILYLFGLILFGGANILAHSLASLFIS